MTTLPNRVLKFIKKHHLLSLATTDENGSWCCSCFYTYIPEENLFIITSEHQTRHIQNLKNSFSVSGTIALETKIVGKIRGIQFSGTIELLKNEKLKIAKKAYIKKFPMAALMETTLWGIKPELIKMTDNRLGFGKKILWKP